MGDICENVDDLIARNWVGYIPTPCDWINVHDTEFKEFCNDLDELGLSCDPEPYVEAVDDSHLKRGHGVANAIQRTAETTKDIGSAYKKVTDAGGDAAFSAWKLVSGALNLIARISSFILKIIGKIPKMILTLARKIGEIPSAIKRKIRGDIALYITAEDLSSIYNNSILAKLELFMSELKELTKGDAWSTMFRRKLNISLGAINPHNKVEQLFENDMKKCRNLEKMYLQLQNVRFTKTTVAIKDEKMQDLYFGNSMIEIKIPRPAVRSSTPDPDAGKTLSLTYLGALQRLIKDLNKFKEEITILNNDLGDKYQTSLDKSTFGKLSTSSRNRVTNTIQMISKVMSVIGDIVRYASTDINTINNSIKKIDAYNRKKEYKNADPERKWQMKGEELEKKYKDKSDKLDRDRAALEERDKQKQETERSKKDTRDRERQLRSEYEKKRQQLESEYQKKLDEGNE